MAAKKATAAKETSDNSAQEVYQFQAETKQLLNLMIHSLYTKKEIFLRELISNSSDALDRLRFEAIQNPQLIAEGEKLEIRIITDEERRTVTVHDNGTGMTREEMISNLGTIAKSGTREMIEKLRQSKSEDSLDQLIGQFGVGFYSSFMVSDKVEVVTRKAGEKTATFWQSEGDGTFKVAQAERERQGTSVTLYLKPEDKDNGIEDFTQEYPIGRVVRQYSDFVVYPIIMRVRRDDTDKDPITGQPKPGAETVINFEDRTLNSMKAIWMRPQSEVPEDEYAEFYRHISNDWKKPQKVLSLKAEGTSEYYGLLFVPEEAPTDLYYIASKPGLRLYVRKILIMENCEELLPHHLRFVKGVVDAIDLPLNVSREMLQHNKQITSIKKHLVKKLLTTFEDMRTNDNENYLKFWAQFGRALKEGINADYDNKDKLLSLCLFESSHDPTKLTTLAEYRARMPQDQEQIYYITGDSRALVEKSPHIEAFLAKGYEVMFLTDRVDELWVQSVWDFEEKKLKDIGKGQIDLGKPEEKEQAKKDREEKQKEYAPLLEFLQKKLDTYVKDVRLSTRLTNSAVCLVGADYDYSPQMERLLQKGKGGGPAQRRIMEINPSHPILSKLHSRFNKDQSDPILADSAELLFWQGLLVEGGELPDPAKFSRLVSELMTQTL